MIPQPITIDGRSGVVLYINASWKPVEPENATLARVLFADGSTAFYTVSKQRALGGPGSGNFGHQGGVGGKDNPGGSTPKGSVHNFKIDFNKEPAAVATPSTEHIGPSEAFQKAFADKGYNTIPVYQTPELFRDYMKLKTATNPLSKEAMEGIALGLDDLKKEAPALHEFLQKNVPLVYAQYDPQVASASFARDPYSNTVKGMMFINGSDEARNTTGNPSDDNFTIASRRASEIATSKEEFEREVYRGIVIHEAGHLADAMTGDGLTRAVIGAVLKNVPDDKLDDFVDQKISGYAATGGPQEATAEIFTAVVMDHELPKELHEVRDEIKNLLKRDMAP